MEACLLVKEDERQQVLNQLSQRLAQPIQQITQQFQPLAKSIGHIGTSLYANYQECLEVERGLDDLSINEYVMLPQRLKQLREQRQAGGRERGKQMTQDAEMRREKVIAMWKSLESTAKRDRVGIIVRNTGIPKSTVWRILSKAGLK
ncbi:hypothetical protein DVB73_19375 [Pseudomonas plecoglossicida]|uniref:Uncharacterized protein n=1 Tax=Pseudomonas plecoglossicida TaxID=70775 RepID=A0AAD0R0T7_PSEDL|nr:hypothetical protein DVB73_19375 [Pseudomonas plecoglossicida]EPB96121.1 hypothetical protein L321_09819 [Pseudomonas plecoglossicida NB2011]